MTDIVPHVGKYYAEGSTAECWMVEELSSLVYSRKPQNDMVPINPVVSETRRLRAMIRQENSAVLPRMCKSNFNR
jgi:hypothetical protein